jgi:hypothetical protein
MIVALFAIWLSWSESARNQTLNTVESKKKHIHQLRGERGWAPNFTADMLGSELQVLVFIHVHGIPGEGPASNRENHSQEAKKKQERVDFKKKKNPPGSPAIMWLLERSHSRLRPPSTVEAARWSWSIVRDLPFPDILAHLTQIESPGKNMHK